MTDSDEKTEKVEDAPDSERLAKEVEAVEANAVRIGDREGIGEAPDVVFAALWTKVLASWDEDKPHQAALSYAIEHEMLPEIAGRYRKLFDDPEKGARAKKKVDGIVVAATQLMLATKTPPREKVPWTWTASVAVVMVLVISFLAYKLFVHH
ncbi:MAG: hypothetical protein JWO86_4751 [Myxococcaceae bacterium]|nr:hypothetical protein [Myxococcaceae bacterium]